MSALAAYGLASGEPESMATETTILSFDPGGTTGWCRASYDSFSTTIRDIEFGQFGHPKHHASVGQLIVNSVERFPHLLVVAEDYRPEFGRAQDYSALEYIGVMEYVCRSRLISFERQNREIKRFWFSDRLKAVGFWPVAQPHAQDAARHWLAYACKQDRKIEAHLMTRIRNS